MTEQKPILSFNKAMDCYEGTVCIQVDAEIFRRMLLKAIEEDETSDLTDTHTWMNAIARVGKIESWIGKPHTKVTPVAAMLPPPPSVVAQVKQAAPLPNPKTRRELAEERLREQVGHVAPHLWDEQCLTPYPGSYVTKVEGTAAKNTRFIERQVLKQLHDEWERGLLTLDQEAAELERLYQAAQQAKVTAKLEVVASAVNGNRFH